MCRTQRIWAAIDRYVGRNFGVCCRLLPRVSRRLADQLRIWIIDLHVDIIIHVTG